MSEQAARNLLVTVLGNSDVQVDSKDRLQPREGGNALLQRLEHGEPVAFTTPLLSPIVTLLEREGARPDRIVLVATDQPDGNHRKQDTLYFAQLVERRLRDEHGFASDAIQIELCRENPADYGIAFPFMRRLFARLRDREGTGMARCALAATGGTPALTAALVIEGTAAYGADARVYYVNRGERDARPLDIARYLLGEELRRALRTHVAAHAYAAAGALCDAQPTAFASLMPDEGQRTLLRALLQHATERLNANLEEAGRALAGVNLDPLTGEERHALAFPPDGAPEREGDAQTIREVIASAEVMYQLAHYFDFITRVATFVDVCSKYIARYHFGVVVAKDEAKRDTIKPWVDERPAVAAYLNRNGTRYDGVPNQRIYRDIVTCLAAGTEREPLAAALANRRLTDLSALRNSCVHNFTRIRHKTLRDKWKDDPDTIVAGLRHLAQLAGVTDVERNPYTTLQGALRRLLDEPPQAAARTSPPGL